MAQLKFGSAGVTAREIDISGPVSQQPVGIPAGIVGTSLKGPAFVPVTVGNLSDWYAKFGQTDGKKFGPLAVVEWLRNARALTYLRVLGAGDGRKRDTVTGDVTAAGFTVGEQEPDSTGVITSNPYANAGGPLGRTYFLGCFMSESAGSTFFSEAGLQTSPTAVPVVRGVLMAASGVIIRMSASLPGATSAAPAPSLVATDANAEGHTTGEVILTENGVPKQEFILLLNGHKGTDVSNPNVITASFDVTSKSYFAKSLNTDPAKLQEAGHYLYAAWDIHPVLAAVTGTGLMTSSFSAGLNGGHEPSAFVVTSSLTRNSGSTTVPNYENFRDRFGHAVSPWLISQKFGGTAQNLFRFHTLDDGNGAGSRLKISIENITPSTDPLNKFGSFTVVLRDWADRDLDKKTLANETFAGVNLDPSSDRYIAKVIGDAHAYFDFDREESQQKLVVEGNYENRSNYVRVEVHTDVENGFVDPSALPVGFRGIDYLLTSGSALPAIATPASGAFTDANVLKSAVQPPLPLRRKITTSTEWTSTEAVEPKFYWGVQFEHPEALLKKNTNTLPNDSLKSFAKYFPNFTVDTAKFLQSAGSDDFNNNMFSLENVMVVTGTNGLANPNKWASAVYARGGSLTAADTTGLGTDASKVRNFKVEDLTSNKTFGKFTLTLQGGFDGTNLFNADELEINNAAVAADMNAVAGRGLNEGPNVRTYLKALDIMKNTVNMDIQLLTIPGIRQPIITDAGILAVEERFDALFLVDVEQQDELGEDVTSDTQLPSVTNTVQVFKDRSVDTSFGAAYFPDILYKDPTGVNLFVPPSVVVLGALALNDAVGHPWFAPAGFTRGALPTAALEPRVRLSQKDMDTLYDNSINPIVSFPGAAQSGTNPSGGLVVWGQKTLQVAASALDRVNVRRLLIEIRRQVRDIAQTIIFEPNRAATLARFSAAVTPRLQRIQSLAGLENFKVVIDSSTTTQDDIENNTLRGKIFVQPTKTLEFVSLDFVVSNNISQ
jgi:phage tail sheath protein FI